MSIKTDEILKANAKKHMVEFELEGFKRTYPSLYKTITDSMNDMVKQTIINRIEHILALGLSIKFSRDFNQFHMAISNHDEDNTKTEGVVLPFDHLNEDKINKYIDLMLEKFKK